MGSVKSSIGIGALLEEGIGDTLRVSLAENPIKEVQLGVNILKSLQLKKKGVNFIACPSCARQEFDVIKVIKVLESRLKDVNTPIDVAIMGCVVNGPGEARMAEIAIVGYRNSSSLYLQGKP